MPELQLRPVEAEGPDRGGILKTLLLHPRTFTHTLSPPSTIQNALSGTSPGSSEQNPLPKFCSGISYLSCCYDKCLSSSNLKGKALLQLTVRRDTVHLGGEDMEAAAPGWLECKAESPSFSHLYGTVSRERQEVGPASNDPLPLSKFHLLKVQLSKLASPDEHQTFKPEILWWTHICPQRSPLQNILFPRPLCAQLQSWLREEMSHPGLENKHRL